MWSLNIGIYLLLIAILFCVEVVNSENSVNPILRTKREIVSGNETISDADNVEIDDVNVIYVCNGENSVVKILMTNVHVSMKR
uniref:Uncharacterized protein n=1 Tax=Panagrolaimus sp. PS1159 TaxID=55785 RepID=A0AC35EZH0_9BILA